VSGKQSPAAPTLRQEAAALPDEVCSGTVFTVVQDARPVSPAALGPPASNDPPQGPDGTGGRQSGRAVSPEGDPCGPELRLHVFHVKQVQIHGWKNMGPMPVPRPEA